jgi:hypothetical protein
MGGLGVEGKGGELESEFEAGALGRSLCSRCSMNRKKGRVSFLEGRMSEG